MKEEVKSATQAGENKSTDLNSTEPEFEDERLNPDGTSVFMCTLTLIGTRIGAGIVGLPYAVQALGPSVGLCFHFLYCFITLGGVILLLKSRVYIGKSTYAEIGAFCFGNISIYIMNAFLKLSNLFIKIN